MERRTFAVLAAVIAMLGPPAVSPASSTGWLDAWQAGAAAPGPAPWIERRAAEYLREEARDFAVGAQLADDLAAARDDVAHPPPMRARLSLLWLRVLRHTLAAVPMDARDRPPFRDWLARREAVVVYSEPAGQWLIAPELIWRVHDQHRASDAAEAIAWIAIDNGLPGECEGYVPCYAHGLDRLQGEYLRRHPRGARAAEAVGMVGESLAQALRLLEDPEHLRFLNPATDCGDLRAPLTALIAALEGSPHGAGSEAPAAARRILALCPA